MSIYQFSQKVEKDIATYCQNEANVTIEFLYQDESVHTNVYECSKDTTPYNVKLITDTLKGGIEKYDKLIVTITTPKGFNRKHTYLNPNHNMENHDQQPKQENPNMGFLSGLLGLSGLGSGNSQDTLMGLSGLVISSQKDNQRIMEISELKQQHFAEIAEYNHKLLFQQNEMDKLKDKNAETKAKLEKVKEEKEKLQKELDELNAKKAEFDSQKNMLEIGQKLAGVFSLIKADETDDPTKAEKREKLGLGLLLGIEGMAALNTNTDSGSSRYEQLKQLGYEDWDDNTHALIHSLIKMVCDHPTIFKTHILPVMAQNKYAIITDSPQTENIL